MWGPDAPTVPPATALRHFAIAVLGFVSFGVVVKYALIPSRPSVPREYPYSGLVTELGGLEENKVSVTNYTLRMYHPQQPCNISRQGQRMSPSRMSKTFCTAILLDTEVQIHIMMLSHTLRSIWHYLESKYPIATS